MFILIANSIPILFNLLLFFVPLVLYPNTSEIFEFNKIVLTYILTSLIVFAWLVKMIINKRIIFRRTILDIPLLILLGSQLLSTIASVDTRTSFFGYYSRFHGGLLSTITYSLLYWAYVSNMNRKKALKSIFILLSTTVIASIYGVLEHLGIDKDLWVQDVQNRVFSTFGQPNWLAAWLTAIIPITWALALSPKFKSQNAKLKFKIQNFWIWIGLSALFFLTLLYTKSRSGIFGFGAAYLVFWAGSFWSYKNKLKPMLTKYLLITFLLSFIAVLVGTPWTPSVKNLLTNNVYKQPQEKVEATGPALETGGTASGEIRKIVWKGALDIWKNYPILGTGVETFAYSYYNFRPVEHNLVSEWDFLYNKAHNEYLNLAATSGTIGLLSYFIFVFYALLAIYKNSKSSSHILHFALMSAIAGILVTNFFGFSVVPIGILLYIFPAISLSLVLKKDIPELKTEKLVPQTSIFLYTLTIPVFLLVLYFSRYWYVDTLYLKGKLENDSGNFAQGRTILQRVIKISPKEAIYWDELSQSNSGIAQALIDEGSNELALKFADFAVKESTLATNLSPANVNLKRNRARMFINLSILNPAYLIDTIKTLEDAVKQAPTDAKLYYNLALAYLRTGNSDKAAEILEKTIKMKANYRNARFAYALVLVDKGEIKKAKEELEYILTHIAPNDSLVKQEYEQLQNN